MLKQNCGVVLLSSVCVKLDILEHADSSNGVFDYCSFVRTQDVPTKRAINVVVYS